MAHAFYIATQGHLDARPQFSFSDDVEFRQGDSKETDLHLTLQMQALRTSWRRMATQCRTIKTDTSRLTSEASASKVKPAAAATPSAPRAACQSQVLSCNLTSDPHIPPLQACIVCDCKHVLVLISNSCRFAVLFGERIHLSPLISYVISASYQQFSFLPLNMDY